MKTRSFLLLFLFLFAAGSAVATRLFGEPLGYSRKTDVPIQADNCQVRKTCPGGPNPCTIALDHDGNPVTGPRIVTLHTGIPSPSLICGAQLFEP